jgi:type VI secretion system protein ImpF
MHWTCISWSSQNSGGFDGMVQQRRAQTSSVFDRLLDFDPDMQADMAVGFGERLRHAKDCIRRDLEVLLNTQQFLAGEQKELPELESSLLKYGTPGFHGLMLATRQQRLRLARAIQELIGIFEPRLFKVSVGLGDEKAETNRLLHLRLRASFKFDDIEETLVFDTTLDPAIRQFKIENV